VTTTPAVFAIKREPELPGQTVVVIGGSSGIGLETARQARAEGADVILTGRDPERLQRAAADLGAVRTAAFDATDPAALDRFFQGLPEQIDHVMVTGPGPYYAPLADLDRDRAHRDFDAHLWLAVAVAQHAIGRVRPGGTLLFMGPGQPHRARLRRHALVGVAARRGPRQTPRPAPRRAPHRARGRPGRRRGARGAPHDQHRCDRCDLRRRRGSTARPRLRVKDREVSVDPVPRGP